MPQSLTKILLHVVFSTKDRLNLIPPHLEKELHLYLAKVCQVNQSVAFRVGGTENHIHIACSLPRNLPLSQLVKEIKAHSSLWIKRSDNNFQYFSWQKGYGAFSLGFSQLDSLLQYIDNQKEHHKIKTFKEEMLNFYQIYKIDYDKRYLFS